MSGTDASMCLKKSVLIDDLEEENGHYCWLLAKNAVSFCSSSPKGHKYMTSVEHGS